VVSRIRTLADLHAQIVPLNATDIARYINGILNISSTDLPHLHCPAIDKTRYEPLLSEPVDAGSETIKYFFALDLRNCLDLLPRLIGSIVEAVRFLSSARCALSIVEGNSPDGTGEVLEELRPQLDALTTTYYFKHSDIDPSNITETDRIGALAQLRNLALQPMLNETEKHKFSGNHTTVAFINDVALCPEDILELLFQRRHLEADMVCAMDWTYLGGDPTFYDVWVARTMKGDSFFHIPEGGSFDFAWNLFWNDEETKARYDSQRPFQVFSCWNGATAFSAAPIIGDDESRGQVAFRHPDKDECYKGEPQVFCKDLWAHGWKRIAVVPTVHLEYSNERARQIKELKGYTNALVHANASDDLIDWLSEPPDEVKCMPHLDDQFFEPWNITLA
jgi:alpha-1,3-mannosyltransferase